MSSNSSGKKLEGFFTGKGFYIVLFLCVAAIGISGYYLIRSVSGSEPAQEPVTANPSVTLPDSSAVFPGEQSHQPQPTPEPAAQPDDPQPKKDAETAAPAQPREVVYTWPVKGQVLRGFTVEALAYDDTLEPLEKKELPCQEEFYILSSAMLPE